MEAHGAPVAEFGQKLVSMLPKPVSAKVTEKAAVDRLSVLYAAIDAVRRGGTFSLSGVYGGAMDPLPLMNLFDKQIQLRMGQANDEAPHGYDIFQRKADGAIKVLLRP